MNTQIKASFKKEILAFTRTKRFLILACVFIGWAALSPLLIKGLDVLAEGIYNEQFMSEIAGITANASTGVMSAVQDLSGIGILVFLLLINSFAGGEQKKRSIMIPQSSGLSAFSYLFPKFIIYPLAIFIFSVAGTLVAGAVSAYIFENNDIVISNLIISGALLGVYLMLYVCLHLSLGTATGKAGMSSAVCIAASMLLPNFFALVDAQMYNPFTLHIRALEIASGEAMSVDVILTVVVTKVIMVLVFFVALFAHNAKRIDNSGNEILV
ncbi:MAG: hypothetical protein FWH08_01555 [Oscillospiraceae bacterium]|nr:hypothetical protein [Oscillospiraceae bacterium]